MDNLPSVINWDSELKGAAALIKSKLVPKEITSAEAALFIIMTGRDLGLSPVQSLRSIRPIQGKIEASADLQLGLFHRSGGKTRWVKLDHTGAELELQASWLIAPHVSKFGIEDAKRAGLMSNSNYAKYPQAMFRSRAITQGLKDIGFLAGAGVYAPGELGGQVVIDESGEVLPAGSVEPPKVAFTDQSGLSGVVESLEDDEREELRNVAQTITDAIKSDEMESALNYWHARDNDAKTAIWAMMDKDMRKALKAADAAARESATQDADPPLVPPSTAAPVPAGMPSIAEISKLIMKGDLDAAADMARSFPAEERTALEAQISRAKAHHK